MNINFLSFSAQAANLKDAFGNNLSDAADNAGYADVYEGSPADIISKIINIVLSFLGVIFLFLIMYAGFRWMTARGNEQQLEKAKDTLTSAIIGLLIVASAYAISYFIMSKITEQTLKSTSLRGNIEQICLNQPV